MEVTQEMKDNAPEISAGESYRLFLDMSSTCTGYVVAKMEGKKVTIVRLGVMWFGNVDNAIKFHKIHQLMGEFYSINAVTDVVYEAYHVNPSQVGNSLVVPEMIGAMKAGLVDAGWGENLSMGYEAISPTAWRAKLGITPIKTPKVYKNGVQKTTRTGRPMYDRDYKTPTINYMDTLFDNKIPKQLISNATGKLRSTPDDLYDALGVCLGWHKKFGCDEFVIADNAFDGV